MSDSSSSPKALIIGVVVVSILVILIIIAFINSWRLRRNAKRDTDFVDEASEHNMNNNSILVIKHDEPEQTDQRYNRRRSRANSRYNQPQQQQQEPHQQRVTFATGENSPPPSYSDTIDPAKVAKPELAAVHYRENDNYYYN